MRWHPERSPRMPMAPAANRRGHREPHTKELLLLWGSLRRGRRLRVASEDLLLHGVVTLGFGVAVRATAEGVLLLGREHEAIASVDGEHQQADRVDDGDGRDR